jgi:uncharacterized RDD family membrane protein YckC
VLGREGWEPIPLPTGLPAIAESDAALVGVPGGVAILTRAGGGDRWFVGVPKDSPGQGGTQRAWTWSEHAVSLSPGLARGAGVRAAVLGGHLVTWQAGEGTVRAWATPMAADGRTFAPGAAAADLADLDGFADLVGVVPLENRGQGAGSERLVVVGVDLTPANRPPDLRAVEVSVRTGREVYRGPVILASLVSKRDYALMGGVLAMVVGLVILTVVSPKPTVLTYPEDSSVAEPPRRLVAGVIDLSLVLFGVGVGLDLSASQVFSLEWWSSPQGQVTYAATVGMLVLYGTVLEAGFGRTIGKFLTGCEVVDVTPARSGHRPGFVQALVRNLIRWGLPPLGVLGVIDPAGRGRADQFARTGVIVREPPEAEDEE